MDFELDKCGIYVNQTNVPVETGFSEGMQNNWFEVEDNSWWFKYRAKVIQELASFFYSKQKLTVDVGGGNGYTTSYLNEAGYNMCLLEPSYQACLNGRRRGLPYVINGTVEDLSQLYDQFMLLDVIEHIEDDNQFLNIIHEKMNVGGLVLFTVPAFMSLWNREDVITGHYRRYTKKIFQELVEDHGFDILYENYFFSFLYIPIKVVRVWLDKFRKHKSFEECKDDVPANQFLCNNFLVNKILGVIEKIEMNRLIKNKRIPFGSSLIIIARKR